MKESIEATVMSMNGSSLQIDVNWKHYDAWRYIARISQSETRLVYRALFFALTHSSICHSLGLFLSLGLWLTHIHTHMHSLAEYINWKEIKPMSNGGNEMMFKLISAFFRSSCRTVRAQRLVRLYLCSTFAFVCHLKRTRKCNNCTSVDYNVRVTNIYFICIYRLRER